MKALVNSLAILVAAGLGLGIGVMLRGRHQARPWPAGTAPAVVGAARGSDSAQGGAHEPTGAAADDSPLATRLERDLSMSTGVIRWLYWLAALEQAVPSDFPRLARLAHGDPTATRLVGSRWIDLAPRHLFDTIVAAAKNGQDRSLDDLVWMLFDEWPKKDPEGVIAALSEAGDITKRDGWRMRVVSTIFGQDVERGLRLMSEWHVEFYGPGMEGIVKWADANPLHAAQFTCQYPAGFASQMTMETIGTEWAKTDPAAALGFAATQAGSLGSTLANSVLKAWAQRDLDAAADWLAAADDHTRNRLSPTFVEVWAGQDASEALAWCEDNLTGNTLAQAVGGVLKGMADKDVAAAAALVAGMDPSPARAQAAASVAHKWFPDFNTDNATPPGAIAWLTGLDPDSVKRVVDQIQWSWATSDPKSMAQFLSSASADEIPASAYSILARQMVRQTPEQALAWANTLPAGAGLDAGAEAFAEWRRTQPEAATQWLAQLPTGDPRRDPYFQDAIRTLAWDSQASQQLAGLAGADRAAARGVIESMQLPSDRRDQLLQVLGGP